MRAWRVVVLFLALSGCDHSAEDEAAEIAMGTLHCGRELVQPDLLMRLSQFQRPGWDMNRMWVVQACHPSGACRPVMTYHHSPPPLYSITSGGDVKIQILGGFIEKIHREEIETGGRKRRVIVDHLRGRRSQAERDRFRPRFDYCDRALEPRPSVRGQARLQGPEARTPGTQTTPTPQDR